MRDHVIISPLENPPGPRAPEKATVERLRGLFDQHPTLIVFLILAPALAAILLVFLRDVALEPSQRAWMVAATVGLAALSAWIISTD